MECITRIDQLSDWMDLICKRDIMTNCYLGPAQYHKYICEKSLYLINESDSPFLLHDLGSHYQMYYCASAATLDLYENDASASVLDSMVSNANSRFPTDRSISVDILYKEKAGLPENLLIYLEQFGFKKYINRLRMSVKNQNYKKCLGISGSIDLIEAQNAECTQGLVNSPNLNSNNTEKNQYSIKLAAFADAQQVLDLITQSFDPYTSCIPKKDELLNIISQNCVLAAYNIDHEGFETYSTEHVDTSKHHIAGVFHFSVEKNSAYVNHLAVSPSARGLGIAGKLLAAGQMLCDQGEKPYWRLWVRQDNLTAQNMYLKYGFQFDGTCCLSVLRNASI